MNLDTERGRIIEAIKKILPDDKSSKVAKATQYMTVENPGSFWRPLLCVAAGRAYGVSSDVLYKIAAISELAQGSSLGLDDLPCMDNADLRRGQPSTHKRFGENCAILGSFALVSRSILTATNNKGLEDEQVREILHELGYALEAMVFGQERDLSQRNLNDLASIVYGLYAQKTGVLFGAAVAMGGVVGEADEEDIRRLRSFGHYLGIAYQIGDDLYDASSVNGNLGKPKGKDAGKKTALTILMNKSKVIALKRETDKRAFRELNLVRRGDMRYLEHVARAIGNIHEPYMQSNSSLVSRR